MIFSKRTKDVSGSPVEKFAHTEMTNMIVNGKIQRVRVLVKNKDKPIVVKTEDSTYIIDRDCKVNEAIITSEINNIVGNDEYANGVSELKNGVAEIVLQEDGKKYKALLSYGSFGIYRVGKNNEYDKKLNENSDTSSDNNLIEKLKILAQSAYDDPLKFKQIVIPLSIIDKQAAFFAMDVAYSRFLDEAENIKSEFTGEIGADNMRQSADDYVKSIIYDIVTAEDMRKHSTSYAEIYDLIETCGIEAFEPDLTVAACYADLMLKDNPSISSLKASANNYELYLKQVKNNKRKVNKSEIDIIVNNFIDSNVTMLKRMKSVLSFLPHSFEFAEGQVKRLSAENNEFADLINSYLIKESEDIMHTNISATALIDRLNKIKDEFSSLTKKAEPEYC